MPREHYRMQGRGCGGAVGWCGDMCASSGRACVQELERRELEAIPRRVEELERLVAQQRRQEAALQERFKLLSRRAGHPDGEEPSGPAEGAAAAEDAPVPMEAS